MPSAAAAGLSIAQVGRFLDAVIELIEPVEIWFLWLLHYELRPQI